MKTLRFYVAATFGYSSMAIIGLGLLLAWVAVQIDGDQQ